MTKPLLEERTKGPADAPIAITEFSDFQCPSCAASQEPLKNILNQFPNLIRLQFRHFPLGMHQFALDAAKSAECASMQRNFWDYHNLLFKEQAVWSKDPDAKTLFLAYANAVKLERVGYAQCLENPQTLAHIEEDKRTGEELQVSSTPTFFINGERFVGAKQLTEKGALFIKATLESLVVRKGNG